MKFFAAVIAALLIVLTLDAAQKNAQKNVKPDASSASKSVPVSFSKDVMPVLSKKCLDCHTTEDESSNRFYVDTYEELMKESKHGVNVIPGKGEESTLIRKMKGTATFGAKMPKRGKPVPDSTIAVISRWIDEGAKKN
ncbi:MAG: c-type cytochrome domain-containing protein [Acidobacteriota bacterium]